MTATPSPRFSSPWFVQFDVIPCRVRPPVCLLGHSEFFALGNLRLVDGALQMSAHMPTYGEQYTVIVLAKETQDLRLRKSNSCAMSAVAVAQDV
ncbi:hypothetical protein Hypma_005086 [Hypsizygus marmoreus]|uniref:Uncharacterized protein n=1 Tax=Hypsizygus marmoreus TaxID=39966 RepID=A0A369JXB8_HYPMA|nr:hypothetical protein Hypma_005086 [Hypsizygus marmoreus]